MDIFAVIMAGGVGARFWPRSRERSPKQLLEIIGNGTMIQNTAYRLDPLVAKERILVITNRHQAAEVQRQLPQVREENIVVEPYGRNTAPAIALAAQIMCRRHGDAVMIALPADHIVHDIRAFHAVLEKAIRVAEQSNGLVTIGITPTHPETGYGYIQYRDEAKDNPYHAQGVYRVKTFAEKPNLETARHFLESGDFVWNSGMFIWKCSAILEAMARHMPEVHDEIRRLAPAIDTDAFPEALESAYHEIRGISIDYGVMEKATNTYVIPGEFGWSDLGSWDEVFRMHPKDEQGNTLLGTVFSKENRNCYISGPKEKIIAAIGCGDLIVIDTADALLICRAGRSQEVKEVVDHLRRKQMNDYL